MSYGTKWAIRAAVFGLMLHLLLASAIICIILLVSRNISIVKSVAIIVPFFIHALEFLSAVSLLRTKRKDYRYMEKCTIWFTSTKYFSPCILFEEGILFSWEFHLVILLAVAFSYCTAIILITKCLSLNCSVIKSRLDEKMPTRVCTESNIQLRHLHNTSTTDASTNNNYNVRSQTFTSSFSLRQDRNFFNHTEYNDRTQFEQICESMLGMENNDTMTEPCISNNENEDDDNDDPYLVVDDDNYLLPTYEDVINRLNSQHFPLPHNQTNDNCNNDFPPSYDDIRFD